jgi:CheY-like chemotaxis protein
VPEKAAPEGAWRTAPVEKVSRGTVVAIDDSPDDAVLLREMLVEQGFDVVVALSGNEGLALARKLVPDLITVDIQMPGLDGWTVIRKLKGDPATRAIPVVIVSIVAMDVQSRGRDLGAVGFVPKPLNARALRYVIQKELQ